MVFLKPKYIVLDAKIIVIIKNIKKINEIRSNDIFKFVRNGDIVELAKLNDMDAEIVEFIVNENSKVLNKKIMNLDFPLTAIIGGIIRQNKGIIALGDFEIQLGDRVLVCSKPESIKKVESLFL